MLAGVPFIYRGQPVVPLHLLPCSIHFRYIHYQHTLSATSSTSIHCLLHPLPAYTVRYILLQHTLSATSSNNIHFRLNLYQNTVHLCYIIYQHTLLLHPLPTYTSATSSTNIHFRYILYQHTIPLHPLPPYTSATSSTSIHFRYILY